MKPMIDQMALIRTIRPWEHGSHDEHASKLESVGTNLRLCLDDEIDSVYMPVTSDETLGRMAYYLAKSLNENGLKTITPDGDLAGSLNDLILASSLNSHASSSTIPNMIHTGNVLANRDNPLSSRVGKIGKKALVIVTSRPFIMGAIAHQHRAQGVPMNDQMFDVEQGAVVPIDLESFGLK